MPTYYFNTSISGPTDADSVWTQDTNAFDGDTATNAISSAAGDETTKFLAAAGTTAPSTGGPISSVKVRVYGNGAQVGLAYIYTDNTYAEKLGNTISWGANGQWGSYITLTAPAAGWSWALLQSMAVKLVATANLNTYLPARVEMLVTVNTLTTNFYLKQGFS